MDGDDVDDEDNDDDYDDDDDIYDNLIVPLVGRRVRCRSWRWRPGFVVFYVVEVDYCGTCGPGRRSRNVSLD